MSIYLGNLSVDEIQNRAGVTFSAELTEFMKETHQASASNIAAGKWHCFDMPFVLLCGDMDTVTKIYSYLQPLASDFKEPLQLSIDKA